MLGVLADQRQEAILTLTPIAYVTAFFLLAATVVGTAVRAAGTISRERELRTLDNLLALPGRRGAALWRASGLEVCYADGGLRSGFPLCYRSASSSARRIWPPCIGWH